MKRMAALSVLLLSLPALGREPQPPVAKRFTTTTTLKWHDDGELEEWGNPAVKAEYEYLKTYSPYHEPAKWVAKLRATKKDRNVLLLKTNMAGGHGGSSGRYDRLRERAFDVAFILGQMGFHS